MSVDVRRVAPAEWAAARDIRLRALLESPTAFGGTHAEAAERPDARWQDWARASDQQSLWLAWDGDVAVGIAGAFHGERWMVFTMWVDPAKRGRGIGRALLDAVVAYVRERNATELYLDVTNGNDAARALYERYGFVDTGASEPLPSHPELQVREMRLAL